MPLVDNFILFYSSHDTHFPITSITDRMVGARRLPADSRAGPSKQGNRANWLAAAILAMAAG